MYGMSPSPGEITHVSDTALMVAACRALESEAPDGFVRDPFAARLAGERGFAILRSLPGAGIMQFGVGVRSRFIDQLLLEALAENPVAAVLSLGCGLDTRPWRLDLPPDLLWIEADFAAMLDYKDERMHGETPRCRRRRVAADLTDAAQRRAIYAAAGMQPALMITEGLLMYLPGATVEALAAEAGEENGAAHWISDISSTGFLKAIQADTSPIRNVQAADFLQGEQIVEVLRSRGWTSAARRSYMTDMTFAAERIQSLFANLRPPEDSPAVAPPLDDPSGVHRFSRR